MTSIATVSQQANPAPFNWNPSATLVQQADSSQAKTLLIGPSIAVVEPDPGYSGDPTPAQTAAAQQAINLIIDNPYAQTEPGNTILNGLLGDLATGKILPGPALAKSNAYSIYVTSGPNEGKIYYDPALANDPNVLATALVHEGSHQTYGARNPGANPNDPNYRLNNEVDAWQNSLNFYKQLPADSPVKPGDMKDRLDSWKDLTPDQLRQAVKQYYKFQ